MYDKKLIQQAFEKGAFTIGTGIKTIQGEPTGDKAIIFGVPKKLPLTQAMAFAFPRKMDGILTDVIVTDMPRALQDPTGRFRPAPGGVSVGHVAISAGTLGCWVKHDGVPVMLSNCHVLANSNDAEIGDSILQPGPHDDGEYPQDAIAKLLAFIPIHFMGEQSGCRYSNAEKWLLNKRNAALGRKTRYEVIVPQADYNKVDAAIAEPLKPEYIKDAILGIDAIAGVRVPELGINVYKMGRTTGHTQGQITQVDVLTQVSYGAGKIAIFEDQVIITPGGFSAGGDSGSAIVANVMYPMLCALLFAGSDQVTIASPIQAVFEALGLTL